MQRERGETKSTKPKQSKTVKIESQPERLSYNDEQSASCYVRRKLLTREEEATLFKLLEEGTEEQKAKAKDDIVKHNSGLVFSIAGKFHGLSQSDLIQEGMMGLLTGIERFEYRRGLKFSTYATHWIRQRISRAVKNQSFLIRVPVCQWETMYKFNRLEVEGQTTKEKAELLEISEDRLRGLIAVMGNLVSLDSNISEDDEERAFYEVIADTEMKSPAEQADGEMLRNSLEQILETIPQRYRTVIEMRFGLDDGIPRTLDFVGEFFGISREGVRQIEARAFQLLRHPSRLNALRRCKDGDVTERVTPKNFDTFRKSKICLLVLTPERFKAAREARGSQRDVAAELGITDVMIESMERGESPIGEDTWKALLSIPKKTHHDFAKYKQVRGAKWE